MTRYYFRFREQDGSWSQWYECSRSRWQQALNNDDEDAMREQGR